MDANLQRDGERLLRSSNAPHPDLVVLKRVFDVVGSILILVLLFPILIAIALAILGTSPGGVLYSQSRVGRQGRQFRFYKFRSMALEGDQLLADFLDSSPAIRSQWDAYQKLPNDPRITPVGAFLRRTSLDELPQLWNVLIGEMSLVGPRPCLPNQVSLHGEAFKEYCSVRPGITGLWQVSGRNRLSYAERVKLDTEYVRNWSLLLDLRIMAKTGSAMFTGH